MFNQVLGNQLVIMNTVEQANPTRTALEDALGKYRKTEQEV